MASKYRGIRAPNKPRQEEKAIAGYKESSRNSRRNGKIWGSMSGQSSGRKNDVNIWMDAILNLLLEQLGKVLREEIGKKWRKKWAGTGKILFPKMECLSPAARPVRRR